MKKNNIAYYDNKLVKKPWGYEYLIFRNKSKLGVWLLFINYKKKTSLHCHPNKKTGFILLSGKAKIQLGLWKSESKYYNSPHKLMIRSGLFHQTEAISKKGVYALEFETPVDKNDLIRYEDNYGRRSKPYEGKKNFSQVPGNFFKVPNKIKKCINHKIDKVKIQIEKHKNFKKINKYKMDTIHGILDGNLVNKDSKKILSLGDIIRTGTLKKLSKNFKIEKYLLILSVSKV